MTQQWTDPQDAGVIVIRMTTILHFPHDIIEGYL
jgi:hypothetical protein